MILLGSASIRPLPKGIQAVLDEYVRARELEVRLWREEGGVWSAVYSSDGEGSDTPGEGAVTLGSFDECEYRLAVAGACPEAPAEQHFLAAVLGNLFRLEEEVRGMGNEIAERYEEITLLYSISETLGSVISLEEAAGTILEEVIGTLGAKRAALWVHDPAGDALYLAAAVGLNGQTGPIALDDPSSVTAQVFRRHEPVIMDPDDVFPRGRYDRGNTQRGYFLSVPVSYTPPQGETRTVGVINLVGRHSDEPFDAGDVQLLSAIASQVGAAVENGRLVAATLRQERLVREMELAHDLQLKLLPSAKRFEGYARIAVRCIPAESVGGDFYHLFRLSGGRLGVMIGDVSSHGFSAALIMALTMSAASIHASEGHPPAEVLRRIHHALIKELETTEMYMTLFYGVIDPAAGRITYANAGHHHAFRVDAEGVAERLGVTNPPFGMLDLPEYSEAEAEWSAGEDVLFLFTDGLSDALGRGEEGGERAVVDVVRAGRGGELEGLLDELFGLSPTDGVLAPHDDRTAVLARI